MLALDTPEEALGGASASALETPDEALGTSAPPPLLDVRARAPPRRRSSAGAAEPLPISSARQSAKRFIIFALTSCITPRPNWAAAPVMRMSVSTCTFVPSGVSSIVDVIVAAAVPWPRASLACARMATRWADSSASSILTVPL